MVFTTTVLYKQKPLPQHARTDHNNSTTHQGRRKQIHSGHAIQKTRDEINGITLHIIISSPL